jgi:hypothetical protein
MTRPLLGVLLLSAALAAQTRDPVKGQKILEQAIQALGGSAYLNARDMRAEGRAYQFTRYEELSGMARIITYEKFPDKYRQEIGKDRDIIFVLNGEKAWDANFRGVAELPAEEVERIRLTRELSVDNILRYRLKEPGLEIAYTGLDLVDGRAADLVEIVDAQNRTVVIAFDQGNHLPLRREWERRLPRTNEREENVEILGKYLKLKGSNVTVPLYIRRERNGIKTFETFLTEAVINAGVSDALFHRPAGPERPDPRRRAQ